MRLSREWGEKKGFNPVCYCHANSDYKKRMIDSLVEASASKDESVIEKALFPFAYMKLVEGTLLKKSYKKYRFYDEKEVRPVPHQEDIEGYEMCLFESQYEEFKKRNRKTILGKNGVDFSFHDVKYVIVGNENNRKEVREFFAKQTEDCSHIVILTKQQVLGDIVGNNHNEELPKINIEPIKASELALKFGKEFFKHNIKV